MHSEDFSADAMTAAVGPCCAAFGPTMFWHAFRAVWNAGAVCSTPGPRGKPPPGNGSGKSVTPCARMHWVNLTPASALVLTEPVVPPARVDDPHAASASTEPPAPSAARTADARGETDA